MASVKDTASFFANGNSKQFEFCLKLYPQVLKLRAEKKNKKPEELIRLDDWYQNELPQKIKQRGKDAHLIHEELVQTMKWKQLRGKSYPQLNYLVKVNTPRAVMQETKKAFKKLPNIEQAITALSNLKGVGTTMASALLAAAAPEIAPFMADECLMAIPEIEGIEYTAKEYLNFVQHIQTTTNRLNTEKDSNATASWSPHRVELALWTHYVASELNPDLLDDLPKGTTYNTSNGITNSYEETTTTAVGGVTVTTTTTPKSTDSEPENPIEPSDESNLEPVVVAANGNKNGIATIDSLDESSTRSEDSLEKPVTPIVANDETNDSDSYSSAKRSIDCEESSAEEQTENSQPETKRLKTIEPSH